MICAYSAVLWDLFYLEVLYKARLAIILDAMLKELLSLSINGDLPLFLSQRVDTITTSPSLITVLLRGHH